MEYILRTSSSDHSVAVYILVENASFSAGTASASLVGDEWWVDRVFVQPTYRGRRGVGRKLVTKLKELVSERGGEKILVSPGGYGEDPRVQLAFYEAMGFRSVGKHTLSCTLQNAIDIPR